MDTSFSKLFSITGLNKIKGINQGLIHGNMGLCILFYVSSRKLENDRLEEIADHLIEEVFENINDKTTLDFENGLCGIAWGIEQIIRNNYVEGDSDIILEGIDSQLFAYLNKERMIGFDFTKGLSGFLFYLTSRLKNYHQNPSLSSRINRELFIHCINQIDDSVTPQLNFISKDMEFNLFWRFPLVLLCLINAMQLNIYNEKIEIMLCLWIQRMETCIPRLHINRLYLAIIFFRAGMILQNSQFDTMCKLLLDSIEIMQLNKEINFNTDKIRYGYNGFFWVLKQARKIIPDNYPKMERLKLFDEEMNLVAESLKKKSQDSHSNEDLQKFDVCVGTTGILLWDILTEQLFVDVLLQNSFNR